MIGRRPRDELPINLHRRRIYILPTRHGILLGVVCFFMLLGALNYNNNIGLMFTFLLSSIAVLSTFFSVHNLIALRVVNVAASPTFAGHQAQLTLTLDNPQGRSRIAVGASCAGNQQLINLPAGQTLNYRLSMPTSQRGWHYPERVRLFTIYPFGMFNAWAWVRPADRVLVYPRLETDPPALPGSSLAGDGNQTARGEEEFAGVRDYQKGDRPHQIAWKAAARNQQLMSKQMEAPGGTELLLDYNELHGLDQESRLSRLASWVTMAQDQNLTYALSLPTVQIAAGSGDAHLHQCLSALATFKS